MKIEYEINSLLDFTKVPHDKLGECLKEFNVWVSIMREVNDSDVLFIPVDKFTWIDDGEKNITVKFKRNPD